MDLDAIMGLDEQYYMNVFGKRFPVAFTHGKGCKLYDTNGREYTDFLAGLAVSSLGYGDDGLVNAIAGQASALIHCSNLYYIEKQAELAKTLCSLSECNKIFLCNSGAEANEAAIKLARKYFYDSGKTDRIEILTAINSFHGRTMATLSATGQNKFHTPYYPLTPSFKYFEYNNLDSVKKLITKETCAIMIETIQGEGGVLPAAPEFLHGVETLCHEHNLLFIIDEIQTGLCRTGSMFSFQKLGLSPDIFTLAKGLGGGMPIGAALAKEHVAKHFNPGDHGSTFGGNPLACSAALYVTQTMLDEKLDEAAASLGAYLEDGLNSFCASFPFALEVRGRGLMLGLGLDESVTAREVVLKALDAGFIIGTAGCNTLRFLPPLIITKAEIDKLLECLKTIFKTY